MINPNNSSGYNSSTRAFLLFISLLFYYSLILITFSSLLIKSISNPPFYFYCNLFLVCFQFISFPVLSRFSLFCFPFISLSVLSRFSFISFSVYLVFSFLLFQFIFVSVYFIGLDKENR